MADYSVQGECRNVKFFIRTFGATEPTEELANKIREHCRTKGRSKNTERLYLFTLENWHAAVHNGKRMNLEKPAAGGKREVYITPAEFRRMMDKVDDLQAASMLALIFYAGLRRKDVTNLNMRDLDIHKRLIWVRDNKGYEGVVFGGTKNHKEEEVPMHKDLKLILEKWLEHRRAQGAIGTSPVFINLPKKLLSNMENRYCIDGLGRLVTTYTKKYHGKPISAHALRHSCASMYANDPNMPITFVQRILRHGDLRVTQGYVHTNTEDIMRQMDKFAEI